MKTKSFLFILVFVFPLSIAFAHAHERLVQIEKEVPRFNGFSPGGYDSGRSIVDQVSDSTITQYITRLVDFRTRFACTDSNVAASQWIYDTFFEFGFTEVYLDSFSFDHPLVTCDVDRNVVAVKPGTVNPEKVIVIGGHYDSVSSPGGECDPDTLAPGADDNASGTSVVLEAARILANVDTDLTLMFVAFGAEELALFGSEHFAEQAYLAGMDIKLMFNMDMVSYRSDEDNWEITVFTDSSSIHFAELVAEMGDSYTDLIPEVVIDPYHRGGDHQPFYQLGYSFVYTLEWELNIFKHSCDDDMEIVSIPYLIEVAEMITPSIFYISNFPDQPSGLNVINVGDGSSLYLSWDPNDELDLAGYYIYWGTQSGVYDSVKTVTTENDTLRNLSDGITYYLAISAFDTDDNESFLTEEVEITASSLPQTPTGITSLSLESTIVINWIANDELDLAGYNLYKWEVDGAPDTVLHAFIPAPTSSYSDDSAEAYVLYGYYVTAVDTQVPPNESDPSESVRGRLATHDMGILVVDNTLDGSGGPFWPTDEEVDMYYSDILRDYNVQALWDHDDSTAVSRYLMDYDAGIYSVILWHSDVRNTQLVDSDTTTMRKFLDTGGNLWLSGWQVLAQLTGRSEPYFVFGGDSFVPNYAGIDSARTTLSSDQDFIGVEDLVAGFPSIFVDSVKVYPIGALYNTEVVLPPFDGSYPIYSYISSDSTSSEYHGMPVAIVRNSIDYGLVFTDFPLYFMDKEGARSLVDAVMDLFEEPLSLGDEKVAVLPRSFSLSQNYPNPFNPSTTIAFDIPAISGENQPITLTIYDIRGRRVRTLIDSELDPGSHKIHWDGRNDRGQSVASGIYLYTLKASEERITRKMTILK